MTKHRLVAAGAVIALLVAALIWFGRAGGDSKAAAGAPPLPQVLAAAAITREHAPRSTYNGALAAVQSVELKPRVSGYVAEVSVPEGQLVRRGQRLFLIDPAPFRARLDVARAATREARARLGLAHAENTRAAQLVAEGVSAQERADQARAALAERQAQLASAEAAERIAALDLAYASVEAPISGRVGKILVTRGNLVAGGEAATPLTTIVSVDPLYVDFNVDEATYLAALAESRARGTVARLPVQVQLENGSRRSARLDFIGNRLDRGTGTIAARALLPNPGGALAPGLFAEVELAIGSPRPAVLVSDLAIGAEQGRRFVLVLGPNNTTQYRPVKVGGVVDGLRVIEDGLRPGERVVVKGLAGPGMKVNPKLVPMPAQAREASAVGPREAAR
ncbi:resistance-nodulation-cell division (RND) efflux membrane fusion protein [Sphingomonas paucimobilis]|uniref:efflux RND transporter periplasmic adaptor subunit n=1 Tax=Sphingomonas paucimobilis TaxID=13689 RepID=UPI00069D9D42|nr:efflux RND transporter periplasmic adaptor subunit [Sphingomonas paucimobilis]BCI72006.1 resistance-nodulation-cell division (RND) efflux membrane fusion protein [Sphingomonas paucimobilis]